MARKILNIYFIGTLVPLHGNFFLLISEKRANVYFLKHFFSVSAPLNIMQKSMPKTSFKTGTNAMMYYFETLHASYAHVNTSLFKIHVYS